MKENKPMKTIKNIIYPALALFAFACFVLSPRAQAVVPAPDGGYPNGNTAEGEDALFSLTTGTDNMAIGFDALYNNTTGIQNTASGSQALFSNTTGSGNTAVGFLALPNNVIGNGNTAAGIDALLSNTAGDNNTAVGFDSLKENTADSNTAIGFQALENNTAGSFNAALGANTLENNTTGSSNTASGVRALENNNGGANTATGTDSLGANISGSGNTAIGTGSLSNNTTGDNNTATGDDALVSNTTGSDNIAIGFKAGLSVTSGSNNIDIGNRGHVGDSQTIRVGTRGTHTDTYVAGISGVSVPEGVGVVIDTKGHLGTIVSSQRYKEAIKPMDKASEAILALAPVTFRYKKELDPEGIPQFGLVAEDVEKLDPDLVARDDKGKPYSVRYEAVNAMLLNEFLKEHRKVEKQEATIAQLKQDFQFKFSEQQKQIEALTAGLQRVSAQVEVSKPAPQVVNSK